MARNTAATKDAVVENETPVVDETPIVNEEVPVETVSDDAPVSRIPEVLSVQSIFADFCQRYLDALDEIAKYNADVLASKDSDWNSTKVMAKAREFASPDDVTKVNEDIKKLYEEFERTVTALNLARKAVVDATAKELGITLSATAERDPEKETVLKDKRSQAKVIGTTLGSIAEMSTQAEVKDAVLKFLADNPLPAIGRDQSHNFGESGSASTPKYRVTVAVSRDGTELATFDGFSKAAINLTKYYERGKGIKADTLREVWEKAGNSKENPYAVSPVEFVDDTNGLHFTIAKK